MIPFNPTRKHFEVVVKNCFLDEALEVATQHAPRSFWPLVVSSYTRERCFLTHGINSRGLRLTFPYEEESVSLISGSLRKNLSRT